MDERTDPHDIDAAPAEPRLTRRRSLLGFGGLVAGGLAVAGWEALAPPGGGPAGVASGAVSCVLAPEQTEGPFYIPNERVRRDITEGKPGAPLALSLSVVDASSCRPVRNASVDIWHADASGAYSGFGAGSGNRTFLRGVQRTDARGVARFTTIYPGWYPGRAVHIHVKVHVAGDVVHTGQLYFSDALTDAVFKRSPYSRRGARQVRNPDDAIYRNGGKRSTLAVRQSGSRYLGSITMGVQLA